MTPTCFLVTPISTPPEEDGWYTIFPEDNPHSTEPYYFLEGDWFETEIEARENENHDALDVDGCFWLKPFDLISVLWQVWNAAEIRQQQVIYCNTYGGEPDAPDRGKFCDSILNPTK